VCVHPFLSCCVRTHACRPTDHHAIVLLPLVALSTTTGIARCQRTSIVCFACTRVPHTCRCASLVLGPTVSICHVRLCPTRCVYTLTSSPHRVTSMAPCRAGLLDTCADFLFKFLVIGNANTGKSCLLHQFIENKCEWRRQHHHTASSHNSTLSCHVSRFVISCRG
jgi:hypothetical protein